MRLTEEGVKISLFTIRVESATAPEFIDITDRVNDFVRQSDIRNGMVLVFSKHTTVAITIQENEPLLLGDMANMLERLSPAKPTTVTTTSRFGRSICTRTNAPTATHTASTWCLEPARRCRL